MFNQIKEYNDNGKVISVIYDNELCSDNKCGRVKRSNKHLREAGLHKDEYSGKVSLKISAPAAKYHEHIIMDEEIIKKTKSITAPSRDNMTTNDFGEIEKEPMKFTENTFLLNKGKGEIYIETKTRNKEISGKNNKIVRVGENGYRLLNNNDLDLLWHVNRNNGLVGSI